MGEEEVTPQHLYGSTFAIGAAVALLVFVVIRSSRDKNLKRLPPGPKGWPIIGNAGQMDEISHQTFADMAKTYGSPVVHLALGSVHLIVVSSMDTAEELLKVQDLNWASRPTTTASTELAYNNQTLSMTPHGPIWRHLRKLYVVELLTAKRIKHFQPVRVEEITEAVRTLLQESNGKKAVSVVAKVKEHLTNILTRMIMNKSYFGSHASAEEAERFQRSLMAVLALLGSIHLGDYIALFKHWDVQGNKKKMKVAHARLDSFLQNVVDERRKQLAERARSTGREESLEEGDFLDELLTRSADQDYVELNDDRIKGILLDTIMAGTDSPANAVGWTLAEILRHPKVLARVQEELDRTVGRERLVEEDDLPKLEYLQAVVKESFRLHPVTPLLLPRTSLEACEIGGFYIPAGTQAFVNIWAIGTDPAVWEKPFDFNPDRFFGNPVDVTGANFQLIPFGSGRRRCPAINMGLLLVQYVLAVLIQSCEWSFPEGQTPDTFDMTEGAGLVNHRRQPLAAIVSRRLPAHILAPTS